VSDSPSKQDIQNPALETLIAQTAAGLKSAQSDQDVLLNVITDFFAKATALGLGFDQIEDILGIDEPSIMDLAELSETDEEIIIDAFERFYGVDDESE
jgi:hypothetical protein